MAAFHAGLPNTTPVNTVNRQCSSGLTAINQIANGISSGQIGIGIGKPVNWGWASERASRPHLVVELLTLLVTPWLKGRASSL
jgi:Thiolase, N-terminal domain